MNQKDIFNGMKSFKIEMNWIIIVNWVIKAINILFDITPNTFIFRSIPTPCWK